MHRHDAGAAAAATVATAATATATAPALHRFSRDRLRAAAWKNGGGATREIACWPPGAGLDDFDWRASIATISASGPFSVFAGVDRTIVLLDGPGVLLRAAPDARGVVGQRFEHRLDRRHEPLDFSGDLALDGTLLPVDAQVDGGAGGNADTPASSDFNVMSRRGRCRADVRVLRAAQPLAGATHGLLMSLRGTWRLCRGPGEILRPGEGLWWADTAMAWHVSPCAASADADADAQAGPDSGDARLIAVRWTFGPPKADARGPAPDLPFSGPAP